MGELVNLDQYREKKAASMPEHKTRRLAEIAFEKLLLQSEENAILRSIGEGPDAV